MAPRQHTHHVLEISQNMLVAFMVRRNLHEAKCEVLSALSDGVCQIHTPNVTHLVTSSHV